MKPDLSMAQLTTALLVAATPWIVVRIARAVASPLAHASGMPIAPSRAFVLLQRATAPALVVVAGFAIWLPAQSGWMQAINAVTFVALAAVGLRALGDLENATRAARRVDSTTRVATLAARRSGQYLPAPWRVLLFGTSLTALALFTWRVTMPSDGRRLFMPVAFALIAPVFLWLYETWIHQLVTGPVVAADGDADRARRRSMRRVFAAECVLVTGFLALANAALYLDWSQGSAWTAITLASGGLLGVFGCALALASELGIRRYAEVEIGRQV
jgi:hypothetical protein